MPPWKTFPLPEKKKDAVSRANMTPVSTTGIPRPQASPTKCWLATSNICCFKCWSFLPLLNLSKMNWKHSSWPLKFVCKKHLLCALTESITSGDEEILWTFLATSTDTLDNRSWKLWNCKETVNIRHESSDRFVVPSASSAQAFRTVLNWNQDADRRPQQCDVLVVGKSFWLSLFNRSGKKSAVCTWHSPLHHKYKSADCIRVNLRWQLCHCVTWWTLQVPTMFGLANSVSRNQIWPQRSAHSLPCCCSGRGWRISWGGAHYLGVVCGADFGPSLICEGVWVNLT